MKNFFERLFRREQPNFNYIIGEYKPNHANAMSKPARTSEDDYDVESAYDKDEMEIDNIYQDS